MSNFSQSGDAFSYFEMASAKRIIGDNSLIITNDTKQEGICWNSPKHGTEDTFWCDWQEFDFRTLYTEDLWWYYENHE